MSLLPMADACSQGYDKAKILKEVYKKQLVGLCNNTKWNEILSTFRQKKWTVSNRCKWISGNISKWENDWNYHLPFPFVGVEWFDIDFEKYEFFIKDGGRHENIINLKSEILEFIQSVGVEYEVADKFVRIWGYGPKCYKEFEAKNT